MFIIQVCHCLPSDYFPLLFMQYSRIFISLKLTNFNYTFHESKITVRIFYNSYLHFVVLKINREVFQYLCVIGTYK